MTHELRFAIVGAGPAGLSAAAVLRQAGFGVTVFDRQHEAGGKVRTIRIGESCIDVGAIVGVRRVGPFGTDYDPIFALSDRFGLETRTFDTAITYDVARRRHHFGVRLRDALAATIPLAKYSLLHTLKWRGHHRGEVGDELSPDLRRPWSELLQAQRLAPLADAFRTMLTSSGYSPDMAAYHQASYFDPGLLVSMMLRGGVQTWVGGYQQLFIRWAKELASDGVEFLFDHEVTAIESGAIRARDRRHAFDEVIVATDVGPLLNAGVLHVDSETRALLDGMHEALDYRSLVARVQGLPDEGRLSIGHIPAYTHRPGFPVLYCQQAPGLYVMYVEGSEPSGRRYSQAEVETHLAQTVERLSSRARLVRVESYNEWRYAPHASAAAVQKGILHRLKHAQGQRGLTFLLAAASFETTARAVQNARDVCERLLPVWRARAPERRSKAERALGELR